MRFLFHLVVLVGVALVTGFGLSYYAVTDGRAFGAYQWGAWKTWPNAGAPAPDPYTHAVIARDGGLQLGRGEGVEFIATHDDGGQRLLRTCAYRISGRTPIAAFWTLRAADNQGASIVPAHAQQAFNSQRLVRSNEGIATLHVGSLIQPGNWMEIEGTGYFELILTFYDASVFAGFGTTITGLPEITSEGCS